MKLKLFKRLGATLVALILSLTFLTPTAFASGVNADGLPGVGSVGYTPGFGRWNSWAYGARVTLVDSTSGERVPGYVSLDYTTQKTVSLSDSKSISIKDVIHFGEYCKSDYRDDPTLCEYKGGYEPLTPPQAFDKNKKVIGTFPVMVSNGSGQNVNILKVKEYFGNPNVVEQFAFRLNDSSSKPITYDEIKSSGKYKFLIEPIVYISYPDLGKVYAATPTELAIWNKASIEPGYTDGYVSRKWGNNNIRANWSTCLYLEKDDIGFKTWNGVTPTNFSYWLDDTHKAYGKGGSDDQIINYLGLATITFDSPAPTVYHHIYNLQLDIPKGAPSMEYEDIKTHIKYKIPIDTENVLNILNNINVTDTDGNPVPYDSITIVCALLNYCLKMGWIDRDIVSDIINSTVPMGSGGWEEVIPCEIDKTATNSGFVDVLGNKVYKVSLDEKRGTLLGTVFSDLQVRNFVKI